MLAGLPNGLDRVPQAGLWLESGLNGRLPTEQGQRGAGEPLPQSAEEQRRTGGSPRRGRGAPRRAADRRAADRRAASRAPVARGGAERAAPGRADAGWAAGGGQEQQELSRGRALRACLSLRWMGTYGSVDGSVLTGRGRLWASDLFRARVGCALSFGPIYNLFFPQFRSIFNVHIRGDQN